MAILPNLASTRLPTLAEAATIGNPQGQATQASELARLLGQYQQTQANLERAQELQGAQYIPNSGALGVLSSLASKYMGGRIRRKEGETAAELTQRILAEQARAENEKALAEENRKAAAERAKIAERIAVARRGDPAELAAYGLKTGSEADGELIQDADGNYYRVRGNQAVAVNIGDAPQRSPAIAGQSGPMLGADMLPALEQSVMQAESGGDPNAVSPKGAIGTMQTMPTTLRDPGFGVAPARDNSPAELERVGKDYLSAMLNKYGDPRLALAAYNWGPGNVDQAMQRTGGDPEAVLAAAPAETRAYVPKVLSGAQAPGAPRQLRGQTKRSENAQGSYRTLSADEVKGYGLPQGTVAQMGPTGQIQIVNKPRDLPTGGQTIENEDGTTTFIPAGKTAEGERNAAGFFGRMSRAQEILDGLQGYDPTNLRDRAAGSITAEGGVSGALARGQITPQGQKYQQAAMDWVRAKLRKESGAAIGKDEARQEYENYFPVYGDSPEVIAQKAAARQQATMAMRQSAGGALPPPKPADKPASNRIRYDAQGNRL